MNISIFQGISGASKASGLVVIIDVFRAVSLECYLVKNNVFKIIPVASIDEVLYYKEKYPNYIFIGERKGEKIPFCDFGNSPSAIEEIDFTNKTIIHTTSAGTRGISSVLTYDEILLGSLVNAKATSEYIKAKGYKNISLVCMGNNGQTEAMEDTICAYYIKSLLENSYYDINKAITLLKQKNGKRFFYKANQHIFPKKDFYLCTDIDKFNFVLKVHKKNNEFYVEKEVNDEI